MIKPKKVFGDSLQHIDPRKDKEMKDKLKENKYLKE